MAVHPGATSGSAHARMAGFLALCVVAHHASMTAADPNLPASTTNNCNASVLSRLTTFIDLFIIKAPLYGGAISRSILWDMVGLSAACGLLAVYSWAGRRCSRKPTLVEATVKGSKAAKSDPGLLKKHSNYEAYETTVAAYPQIRTFYHPHPQAEKLPKEPKPLPLLVFVHGLGGSLAQFNPLLTGLVNVAPCFGIDFPGCGLSEFLPQDWDAYSHAALVELLDVAIEQALERAKTQEVVLICHSMGCSIAASLVNNSPASTYTARRAVVGIVAVCPKVSLPTVKQVKSIQSLLRIPTPVFNAWRAWDRRGGIGSASVTRMIGSTASVESKKLQLKFNQQSKTPVWRRMAWGATPSIDEDQCLTGGLPGPAVWSQISVPLFVVAGEDDRVTKPEEVAVIAQALGRDRSSVSGGPVVPYATGTDAEQAEVPSTRGSPNTLASARTRVGHFDMDIPLIEKEHPSDLDHLQAAPQAKRAVLKTTVLPSPASHGLLYDHSTYRTLSGLIQTFLADHIDNRLSLGWQLQHLKDSNKWDVKNLAKWQGVKPVSEPIADIFRAMKTMREVDEVHSPSRFVADWSDKIKAVIDISHDCPVYSPHALEAGGIEYHKFPTVSKIPPTPEECKDFIGLVDQLRAEEQAAGEQQVDQAPERGQRLIGVHCHYGFNRTGFFICSYLIERERFGVQQAIDEFTARRPPGIRHEHFLDTLFVRYCVGLKRAPTL